MCMMVHALLDKKMGINDEHFNYNILNNLFKSVFSNLYFSRVTTCKEVNGLSNNAWIEFEFHMMGWGSQPANYPEHVNVQ